MRRKKKGATFAGKVAAIMHEQAMPESRARRIVGAMVRDAKELAGRLTKKKKAKRARVLKAAHALHETMK